MTTIQDLCDHPELDEVPLARMGISLPGWLEAIDPNITARDVENIAYHGVAANAHRSCFYADAARVMERHGDDVLAYLDDLDIEITTKDRSWGGLASDCLGAAVEAWCCPDNDVEDEIIAFLESVGVEYSGDEVDDLVTYFASQKGGK